MIQRRSFISACRGQNKSLSDNVPIAEVAGLVRRPDICVVRFYAIAIVERTTSRVIFGQMRI